MFRCMGCMKEYEEEYEVCPYCGYVRGSEADEVYHLKPETILNKRYIIGKVVGFGGFGVTYVAWDCLLNQKVAVKEYMPSEFATRMPGETVLTIFSGDRKEQFTAGRDKFIDEAKRLAKFNQLDGVVHVYDTFEENNTAYIIMEFLEGENLKTYLEKNKTLSVDEALAITIAVLETLKEVHKEGLIHRDIAPDNIFLTADNQVKLLDFGAARFATTKHSKSLSVILKPGYSPQEQYRSRGDQGPWTDVYAVAATFYKLITGITLQDSMERSIKDNVKEPSKMGVKISKNLENAIMNALNVQIEDRTPSAEAFLEELQAEEVKRIKAKIRKMDIGKWPLWTKISASVACCTILTFGVLLATGIIRFNTAIFTHGVRLAEGQARVPSVTNHTIEDAEELCNDSGLILQIVGKDYSDTVPEGYVLMQSVLGGQIVETDEVNTIGVVVSAGIEEKVMPDLYGYNIEKAEEELDSLDLLYETEEKQNIVAPGAVSVQDIEREQSVESGTSVGLSVSTGVEYNENVETTVPNIVGMDEYEAAAVLNEAGLYFEKKDMTYDNASDKYQVISQEIPEGTAAIKGDVIEVVVSLGSEIKVADVCYKTEAEAYEMLTKQTLMVAVVYEDSDTVAGGHVIRQSVEPGTIVKANTEITIYVSNGREDAQVIDATDVNITPEVQENYDESTTEVPLIVFNEPTTEEQLVTVPNVVGKQYSAVETSLNGQGLVVSHSYKSDKNSTDGTILTQSLASGSQVQSGTAIVLVVCNNETKTQYATRTVTEETTESQDSSMDGWTLYDVQSNTTYGAWSEWSAAPIAGSDTRTVHMQYQYQDKQFTTSTSTSLGGWTLVSSTPVSVVYSGWGANQTTTTKPTPSDVLEITNTTSKTTYHYFHNVNLYQNGKWGVDSVSSGSGNGDTIVETKGRHTYDTTTPLSKVNFQDIGGKQGYGNHTCTQGTCAKYGAFNYWFLDSKTTTTTYTYHTRAKTCTYQFYQWGPWSEWSDTPYTASDTRNVNVRYRYQDRTITTTYYFKRTVYGEFSDWTDEKPEEQDGVEIKTREVYIY